MEESLVSFTVAKLAKEKGFNTPSHSYYFEDGEFKEFEINDTYGYYGEEYTVELEEFYENWNDGFKTTKEEIRCFGCDKNPKYFETFSAPTQALLQRWLREIHGINVISNTDITLSWIYTIQSLYPQASYVGQYILSNFVYSTYEEALEKGLQEALKLIK